MAPAPRASSSAYREGLYRPRRRAQPYAATFSGLYYRKDNEGPWLVPQRWIDARETLNPVTRSIS
jgi:hypothetical protein